MTITKQDLPILFDRVEALAMEDIIGKEVSLSKKGSNYYGLCPFHNDKNVGSFVVTPRKGVWKCFTCGDKMGGNSIRFVSLYYKIGYIQAAIKIGFDFGVISREEYDNLSSTKFKEVDIRKWEERGLLKKTHYENNKGTPQQLDTVYSLFIKCCGLTELDTKYILKERGLEESLLTEFFTFPKYPNTFAKKFEKVLLENNIDVEILGKIPGFFFEKASGKWTFMKSNGIGIAIRDLKHRIIGIQIRRLQFTHGSRYIWFSSTFACFDERYSSGSGPGSPIDVMNPLKQSYKIIAITEGKFKSIELAKLNVMSLSMQGVANYKSAVQGLKLITETNEYYSPEKLQVWLCYDADIKTNPDVYKNAMKLVEEIKPYCNKIFFRVWDACYGKGFDDVIKNGNIKHIKKVKFITFYRRRKTKKKVYSNIPSKLNNYKEKEPMVA